MTVNRSVREGVLVYINKVKHDVPVSRRHGLPVSDPQRESITLALASLPLELGTLSCGTGNADLNVTIALVTISQYQPSSRLLVAG